MLKVCCVNKSGIMCVSSLWMGEICSMHVGQYSKHNKEKIAVLVVGGADERENLLQRQAFIAFL